MAQVSQVALYFVYLAIAALVAAYFQVGGAGQGGGGSGVEGGVGLGLRFQVEEAGGGRGWEQRQGRTLNPKHVTLQLARGVHPPHLLLLPTRPLPLSRPRSGCGRALVRPASCAKHTSAPYFGRTLSTLTPRPPLAACCRWGVWGMWEMCGGGGCGETGGRGQAAEFGCVQSFSISTDDAHRSLASFILLPALNP